MSEPTSPQPGPSAAARPAVLSDLTQDSAAPQSAEGQRHDERAFGPFPRSMPGGPDGPFPSGGPFCPNCGSKNSPQAAMCQACQGPLPLFGQGVFCPSCGTPASKDAVMCPACQGPMPLFAGQAPIMERSDRALGAIVPVGVNWLALLAGYLGLFSVLGVVGPFALVCGVLALRELKRAPHERGRVRAWVGVVMGTLGTGLLLFIIAGLLFR